MIIHMTCDKINWTGTTKISVWLEITDEHWQPIKTSYQNLFFSTGNQSHKKQLFILTLMEPEQLGYSLLCSQEHSDK